MYTIANIRPFGHNVGNTAISFAIKNMLYDTFGRLVTVIDYPATSKHESTAKAGLSKQTIHEINRFADGVIVGGGNLYENDEIDINHEALKHLKAPLMLFSNSRGRIYGRNGKFEERTDVIPDEKLKKLVEKSIISASRDSATHKYIKDLGCEDTLGYCPTINLSSYEHLLPNLPENEHVGALISIRTPSLMNLPISKQSSIQSDIASAINDLRKNGHSRIRVLCNDSRDLDFAVQFKGSLKVDPIYTNDVYQYLALIKHASIIISYRLHATLPAVSFGTPVVNITYDERAESICKDFDILENSIQIMNNKINVQEEVSKMISDGGYRSKTDTAKEALWDEVSQKQRTLFKEFKNHVESYVTECKS